MSESDAAPGRSVYSSERAKAFIDAVVAIALTLLILPLMESVGDVASDGGLAAEWFAEHQQQLISFALSFAIIAMFWISHHRLFAGVELVTTGLLWLTMLWLVSIVWLPVATALNGQMEPDALSKTVYIGSMLFTALATLVLRLFLRAHPSLHAIDEIDLRRGMAVDVAMALLFAVALAVSIAVPAVGFWALFIMFLVSPVQALLARAFGASRTREVSGTGR